MWMVFSADGSEYEKFIITFMSLFVLGFCNVYVTLLSLVIGTLLFLLIFLGLLWERIFKWGWFPLYALLTIRSIKNGFL